MKASRLFLPNRLVLSSRLVLSKPRPALPTLFLLSLFSASWGTPALADLYQWKDENGRVHFSDTQPSASGRNAPAVNTLKKPEPPRPSGAANDADTGKSSSTSAERQQRLLELMKQDAEQKDQERQNQQRKQQQREAQCAELREHQGHMAGRPLFRTGESDSNGERKYLDEDERQIYEQQIAAAIAEKCK
jgi:hypothetical protein